MNRLQIIYKSMFYDLDVSSIRMWQIKIQIDKDEHINPKIVNLEYDLEFCFY